MAAEVAANRAMAEQLGVDLVVEVMNPDTTAAVDSRRIRRILRNLITNAVEHLRENPGLSASRPTRCRSP